MMRRRAKKTTMSMMPRGERAELSELYCSTPVRIDTCPRIIINRPPNLWMPWKMWINFDDHSSLR